MNTRGKDSCESEGGVENEVELEREDEIEEEESECESERENSEEEKEHGMKDVMFRLHDGKCCVFIEMHRKKIIV